MGLLINSSLLVSMGFMLSYFWIKSGEGAVVTREDYNKVLATSLLWVILVYNQVKEAINSLRLENTPLDESDGFGDTRINFLNDRKED